MSDLFQVAAPCVIRLPSDDKRLMAEKFRHPAGLLYFDLYWHQAAPPEHAFHLVEGKLEGDGPWKIAGHIVSVLGCQGTDPQLSAEWQAWQSYIMSHVSDYPPPGLVQAIARKMGVARGD